MDEINFHNNFKMMGELMLMFAKKDKETADKYMKCLNEMYFYTKFRNE